MSSPVPKSRISAYYTVREAAWILGVDPSVLCAAIRTSALPTARRRSRLMVSAYALVWLLDPPAVTNSTTPSGRAGGDAR